MGRAFEAAVAPCVEQAGIDFPMNPMGVPTEYHYSERFGVWTVSAAEM